MRNLFSYVPLPGHVFLLLLAVIMRLPAMLLPDFFLAEESLLWTCAERIVGEPALYADAWYEGPPLVVWLYSNLINLFGSEGGLTVLRIISALYVYAFAAYLQGGMIAYRVQDKRRYIAGVFTVLLLSLPWYGLTLSPALLSLFPFAFSLFLILRLVQDDNTSRSLIFYAGLALASLILIDYAGIVLVFAAFVAYILVRGLRVDELVTAGIGLSLGLFMVVAWLYMHDAIGSFVDIGFFSYFRYVLSNAPSPFDPDWGVLLADILLNWGALILLGAYGLFHFRAKLFSFVIVARRMEGMMLVWLIFGAIILVFSGSRLQIHDFAVIAPPIAFYASKAWELRQGLFLKAFLWVILLVPPAALYLDMFSRYQSSWTALPDNLSEQLGANYMFLPDAEKLREVMPKSAETLWVAAAQPQLYSFLQKKPATPFIDYRSTYHRISYFNPELSSSATPDAYLFKQFQQGLPDVIIDQGDIVPQLKRRFPTLFYGYLEKDAGQWKVWVRE
ncbi:MAG: ArnT family glycosyltransferase [Bacteroidia bacterium]